MATRKRGARRTAARAKAGRGRAAEPAVEEDETAPGEASRPIWRGVISFGLVNVPVTLHAGERRVDLHFRLLDSRNRAPVRYERVNTETGDEVPWSEIVKAFEYQKGSYVLLEKEEIREAAPKGTETVEIESFVKREEVNPMYYEKPYYLVPGKKAEKGYVLLRDTLKDAKKVGVARVVIRTREYLAILMPVKQALVLNLLRYEQELVQPEAFQLPSADHAAVRITKREETLAAQVVDSMSSRWRPAAYRDEFRERLVKLIRERMARGGHADHRREREALPPEAATNVVDFMPLLQKSIAARRKAGRKARPRARGGNQRA